MRIAIALLVAFAASRLHAADPVVQEVAQGGKTVLLLRGTWEGMPGQFVIDPRHITGVFAPSNPKGTSLVVLSGFAVQLERATAADLRRILVLVHGEDAVKAMGK
jgi:hypothetical protein